ncbi:hypothetical protein J6590_019184 [Homalodisca vitripennis]|nr:hypothetical protein J6590_019184 [Homalodisca vitripennis]
MLRVARTTDKQCCTDSCVTCMAHEVESAACVLTTAQPERWVPWHNAVFDILSLLLSSDRYSELHLPFNFVFSTGTMSDVTTANGEYG